MFLSSFQSYYLFKIFKPGIICLLVLLANLSNGQSILKGNAGEAILTPPLEMNYTLGGYGARMNRPAEAIHDDIKAKALILDDGAKKYAIITLDILGLPPNVQHMIADKLSGNGWTQENILLLPSHAHTSLEMFALNDKNIFNNSAIGIFQPELMDFVVDKLATLITDTDKDLHDLNIGTGQVKLEGLNRNRRGDAAVDKELTVTRVDLSDGEPLAVLVNWTAHPTIMDEDDMWVSGGWPGYLQRELEDWIGGGVVAMFYNGAEGDQSVVANKGSSHYEKAEYYGREIAIHAKGIYDNITPKQESEFKSTYEIIDLPPRKAHPSFMQTGGEEYKLSEEMIQGLLEQVLPTNTAVSVVQIGELMIVGAPGEMIAELGMDIKNSLKESGIAYPVIGGLANEWISYILTPEEYHQSGYECSVSFYGETLGTVIHDGMLKSATNLMR
jgi:hypothetical protein